MTLFGRMDRKVQLYFNCPEKMDRIAKMCKHTDYKDMTIIITIMGKRALDARLRVKFGKGWIQVEVFVALLHRTYVPAPVLSICTSLCSGQFSHTKPVAFHSGKNTSSHWCWVFQRPQHTSPPAFPELIQIPYVFQMLTEWYSCPFRTCCSC